MTMQVNMREFANLSEAQMLRWRGFRFAAEVEDDYGEKALTDTYALMLTWQGLIVHRRYDKVPYSVKELVPSNQDGTGKEIVYNDKTLAIPVNYILQEIMPNIHDPVENDFIKVMVYNWQTKLNNLIVVMTERSIISAQAESVLELRDDPDVTEIRRRVLAKEISIDDGEVLFSELIKTSPALNNNTVALLARTGGVSINQAYQTAGIRGSVFDLGNGILPNPIYSNYAEGIVNLADSLGDSRGSGKAEVVTNLIKIPDGWKKMGDLQVGEQVVIPDGSRATITHVHPQGITKVLRVNFVDGRHVDVSPDHLWKVHKRNWLKGQPKEKHAGRYWRVCTTQELVTMLGKTNGDGGWLYVPLAEAEQNTAKEFKLHPYVMGVLLGDGSFTAGGVEITKPYQSLLDKVQGLLPDHLECEWKPSGGGKTFSITYKKGINKTHWHPRYALAEHNLMGKRSWEKGIPEVYLHGSRQQRLELLQGLLDTDGTIDTKGGISFSSSSKQLALGVQYLVWSLGGIAKMGTRVPHYTVDGERKPGRVDYRISIRYPNTTELFTLPHKAARTGIHQYSENLRLRIASIEEQPDQETKCITIDHPDHLYVTKNFVVTHNSLISNGKALKDSEWFHRKIHIFGAVIHSIDHMSDCGSTDVVPLRITCAEMAAAMMGKYRQMDDGSTQLIDPKMAKTIKAGETIHVRSAAFCRLGKDGAPCGKCYGAMKAHIPYNVMMRRDANVGMYSGTTICNPLGQKMLSTKHFIRNATAKKFVAHQRDKDIITTNGNEIFLTSEICREGTRMVLRSGIVKDLADLRSLDVLDEVSLENLPGFAEVTFKYEIEDVMMGGTTTQQHPAITSVSSRHARFSMGFLRYVLEHNWEVEDKRFISVDLSKWNYEEPIFVLPFTREDLDAHRSRVENFLTFNKRNNAWRKQVVTPKIFGEVWSEFWTLINQETKGINGIHPEIILACALTKDPANLSYKLANGPGDKYFASFISCIEHRDAGSLMMFEKQQNVLNNPRTMMVKDRQASPLACFFQHGVS